MDHGRLKQKPMSTFVAIQTIFLFGLSSSRDRRGIPLGPVGSAQISSQLYYHPQAQLQRTPEIVTAYPWLVTHFSKCPETVHSGGWRYCFSPFPCKSPVSPMWPWQLPSNSLDVSIFSYSSHFTWIVFIHIRSSATHLNQVFLEAKPTQSACKWSLGIWSGFKYAKTLIEEPSSGKEDIHQEFLTVERSWVPDKSRIVIQIWEHNGSLSKCALLQKLKIKKGCQGQF